MPARCTIGQDRATSAVYGMPAAAKAMGAVSEELPIGAIAARVSRLVASEPAVERATPSDALREAAR